MHGMFQDVLWHSMTFHDFLSTLNNSFWNLLACSIIFYVTTCDIPSHSGMFQDVPGCSRIFHNVLSCSSMFYLWYNTVRLSIFFCHDLWYLISVLYSSCKLRVEHVKLGIYLKWILCVCYVRIPKESGRDREQKIKGRKRIRLIAIDYRSATGTAGMRRRRSKSASRPESGMDSGGPLRDTGTEVLDQSREDGKK